MLIYPLFATTDPRYICKQPSLVSDKPLQLPFVIKIQFNLKAFSTADMLATAFRRVHSPLNVPTGVCTTWNLLFSTSRACQRKKTRKILQRFEELPHLGKPAGNPLQHAEVVSRGGGFGENRKRLRVAVVGIPNSGKSTLVNRLVSSFVCPYSARDNTTLQNCRAILTTNDVQVSTTF